MSISKSLFYALLSSFLLVVVAGSAFTGFQSWVVTHSGAQKNINQPVFISSELRISSSPLSFTEPETPVLTPTVKNTTVTPPFNREPDSETFLNNSSPSNLPGLTSSRPVQPAQSHLDNPIGTTLEYTLTPIVSEPSIVLYEDEIAVEFPKAVADLKTIKQSLARLILSPEPFSEELISQKSLSFKAQPYFYKQVLDQRGQPIRYPANALAYIEALIKTDALHNVEDDDGQFTVVHIPLTQPQYPKPIQRYKTWVDNYAKEFEVSPALVFAIIETESGFRPEAVSTSQAMGLMQLKASAAGKDVFKMIDKKNGQPNRTQLFDEQENIRMGTAYLGLLKHDYLANVRNAQNKELLAISSYNGGLSTVLKLFGSSNEKAVEQINRLHPRQVYRKLRFDHQSKETRDYLDKVLKAKRRYQEMLEA